MSNLPERVEASLRAQKLLRDGESLLIAVSGGADSMALLHLLARLAPLHRWRLVVAHFNHQLRGRDSDADERLVRRTAKKLGLPFIAARAEVRAHASNTGDSIEMAARKLRHEFLARVALRRKIRVIALAHHADDQVELFFLRLLRGAGAVGLAGMKSRNPSPARPEISLVRPLLAESKASLKAWVVREKIPFREDASNASLEPLRNRVRHGLIPLLARKFQPALPQVILRQMDILAAEDECLNLAAHKWLGSRRRPAFNTLPVALQRRCLQVQLSQKGVSPSFDLIEQLRGFENRAVTVAKGICVLRDLAGRVHLQTAPVPAFADRQIARPLAGRAGGFALGNVHFTWEIAPLPNGTFHAPKKSVNCEHFDADKVGVAIRLRHWRPGDRFHPIGMERPVKLQNLFTNLKIPRAARHRLVVATTAAGEIFWVEGLRLAAPFKLDKNTTRGLKWRWERV